MIAISYRRDDTKPITGRLYDHLAAEFGEERVFMDIDAVPYGVDFREHVQHSLEKADVLLVVIGRKWLGRRGRRTRIQESEDYVRSEVAAALKMGTPIIPVLIDNTPMPSAEVLPDEIKALSFRNGLTLDSGVDFHHHVTRLIYRIKELSGAKVSSPSLRRPHQPWTFTWRRKAFVSAALTLLLGSAVVWYSRSPQSLTAARGRPWVNSLGMEFVPVPITGGPTAGQAVLFSVWDTRVRDFAQFIQESGYDMGNGNAAYTLESLPDGSCKWMQVGGDWRDPHFPAKAGQDGDHPVVCASWDDAHAFCGWLTDREHKSRILPARWVYRLPTDHEWSCAVGIGDKENPQESAVDKDGKIRGLYPWGKQWPPPQGAGNFAGEELTGARLPFSGLIPGYKDAHLRTSPVGYYAVNQFGLFDIGGNVWQLCEDKYKPEDRLRVARGGSWDRGGNRAGGDFLLLSHRDGIYPADRNSCYGFRLVLAKGSPPF